jgi:hypothetical protein
MQKPSDSKLTLIKFCRGLSYFVYGFSLLATIFLVLGFFLLLFGANTSTPFVQFIGRGASEFMAPFRGIFPVHQVGESSYFAPGILFAIIMYLLFAAAVNALIEYLTTVMTRHQNELEVALKLNKKA